MEKAYQEDNTSGAYQSRRPFSQFRKQVIGDFSYEVCNHHWGDGKLRVLYTLDASGVSKRCVNLVQEAYERVTG